MTRNVLTLLLLLNAVPAAAEPPAQVVPVVEMWFVSAEMPPAQPELAVYSNGAVRVHVGSGQYLDGVLSQQQVQDLQRELLVDCQLQVLSSPAISAEIQEASDVTGLTWMIPRADDTVIRVRQADGRFHEVRCHAVGLLASRFPSAQGLQNVHRAQQRLQNVRAVLQVGGNEAAEGLAQYATRSVRQQSPGLPELTPGDLAMVRSFPDGTRYIQFCRPMSDGTAIEVSPLIVSVTEAPGEPPRVSVFGGAGLQR